MHETLVQVEQSANARLGGLAPLVMLGHLQEQLVYQLHHDRIANGELRVGLVGTRVMVVVGRGGFLGTMS